MITESELAQWEEDAGAVLHADLFHEHWCGIVLTLIQAVRERDGWIKEKNDSLERIVNNICNHKCPCDRDEARESLAIGAKGGVTLELKRRDECMFCHISKSKYQNLIIERDRYKAALEEIKKRFFYCEEEHCTIAREALENAPKKEG